jgi:hypothetical protein
MPFRLHPVEEDTGLKSVLQRKLNLGRPQFYIFLWDFLHVMYLNIYGYLWQ